MKKIVRPVFSAVLLIGMLAVPFLFSGSAPEAKSDCDSACPEQCLAEAQLCWDLAVAAYQSCLGPSPTATEVVLCGQAYNAALDSCDQQQNACVGNCPNPCLIGGGSPGHPDPVEIGLK